MQVKIRIGRQTLPAVVEGIPVAGDPTVDVAVVALLATNLEDVATQAHQGRGQALMAPTTTTIEEGKLMIAPSAKCASKRGTPLNAASTDSRRTLFLIRSS